MSVLTTVIGALTKPIADLISEVVTDKDKANEIAFKVATMAAEQAHAETLAQLEVNKQEAAHTSLFVAGWRPAMGWTCVSAYFLAYVGLPLISFVSDVLGNQIELPVIDFNALAPVLLGMLGLGALRTVEKVKGTV